MQHTIPIIDGQRCDFASHFFPKFKVCYYANEIDGRPVLTPDPTKVMPKENTLKDGSKRLELSVILHVHENDILWEVGKKLYPVSGIAQCCIDIPCASCGAELFIETDEESVDRISEFHANVLGWSDDESYRQLQAIELLSNSRCVINPKCNTQFENYQKRTLIEYIDKYKIKISVSPLTKSE